MEQAIQMVATVSLSHWGLTLHYGTTEPGAVLQVLAERYDFWEDDVPHADPFHGRLTLGTQAKAT